MSIFQKLLLLVSELAVLCLLSCFISSLAVAQVIINEVYPAPSTSSEWFELKNVGTASADLSGWSISDSAAVLNPSPVFANRVFAPGEYAVFELSSKLNNAGDKLMLSNSAGQIVDSFEYSSSQTDMSWARSPDATGSFALQAPSRGIANLSPSPSPSPTPTPSPSPQPSPSVSPNPSLIPSPTPTPQASPSPVSYPTLKLSEIMACPETGNSEWIELYNPDSSPYTLTNWKIRDSAGTRKAISGSISAQGYTAFHLSTSILNNDGDQVSLENPAGVTLSTVAFSECQKGTSFIEHEGTWQQTFTITKDSANTFTADAEEVPERGEATSLASQSPSAEKSSFSSSSSDLTDEVPSTQSGITKTKSDVFPIASFSAELLASLTKFHFDNQATPSSHNTADQEITRVQSPPKAPNKFLILGPMAIGISLMATSSYFFYKWYTEKRAQEDFDFA